MRKRNNVNWTWNIIRELCRIVSAVGKDSNISIKCSVRVFLRHPIRKYARCAYRRSNNSEMWRFSIFCSIYTDCAASPPPDSRRPHPRRLSAVSLHQIHSQPVSKLRTADPPTGRNNLSRGLAPQSSDVYNPHISRFWRRSVSCSLQSQRGINFLHYFLSSDFFTFV